DVEQNALGICIHFSFGLQYQQNIVMGPPENQYLYNVKELQKRTGMLDCGARQYDPLIGRWNLVDQLAEQGKRWSPYNYTFVNSLNFIEAENIYSHYYS